MSTSQFSYSEARIDSFNAADKSKMGTAEMKFLLKAAGHAFLDEIEIRAIRDELRVFDIGINPLTPNDHYRCRTAPLTSKRCILYIYSTNIGTEYFKHGIHS